MVFAGLRAVRHDGGSLQELFLLSLKMALLVPLLIGLIFVLLSAVIKIYGNISKPRRAKCAASTKQRLKTEYIVEITDGALTVTDPKDDTHSIGLDKITSIITQTNDSGPWGEDVWFIITGEDADEICVYPLGATNEEAALAYFSSLPGFELKGMDSTTNEQFICWAK